MYSKEFWDSVYENQNNNPPRTAEEHGKNATDFLQECIPLDLKGKNILDYGCGNGHIGEKFLHKGANVDFAEISDKMIELLKQKYLYSNNVHQVLSAGDGPGKVNIFDVNSPKDLLDKGLSYDYIIAWAVFHHINPSLRSEFLVSFNELLQNDGTLIIAGWDESDIVLQQDKELGHVTGQPSFAINNIGTYLDGEKYEIIDTGLFNEKLPAFDIPRIFRYYVIKKK